MKKITRSLLFLIIMLLLAACSVASAQNGGQITPTPTEDCGCSLADILTTPTGGIAAAGPAGPVADTATPAPLESYQGQWETYSNAEYGFSFEYPAAYDGSDFGFCAARANDTAPEGSLFALSLGSRTSLVLSDAGGQDLQAVVDAYRGDPTHQADQFDAATERTVGGVDALVLPYRSGGTNRYAEAVFFIKGSTLYRVDTGTPSACDVPAINLRELDAYSHLLDSFAFAQ